MDEGERLVGTDANEESSATTGKFAKASSVVGLSRIGARDFSCAGTGQLRSTPLRNIDEAPMDAYGSESSASDDDFSKIASSQQHHGQDPAERSTRRVKRGKSSSVTTSGASLIPCQTP